MSLVLADTSVWVEHFRLGVPLFEELLASQRLLGHPLVVGELACGNLREREATLLLLDELPSAALATAAEVREAIERRRLCGRGVGLVDVHLLVAAMLTHSATLWSRDRRLRALASEAGIAFSEDRLH